MKSSVIILNWNGAEMLKQFLPSVVEHSTLPNCEVIVADNGSTDYSQQVVASFPSVQWLPLGQNYGFAEGYNRAIATIKSEYTILLNSDVEVTANWLSTLLDYMDSHPSVGACQPKILQYKNRSFFEHAGAAGGHIDILGYPYCRGRILDEVEEDKGQYNTPERCFWASGACFCIRTQVYKDAGGLDTDFFAHMEEIDLCWRIQTQGWEVNCEPTATVYHVGGASLPYGNPRKTYLNFRNNLLMLYKNSEWWQLIWVLPIRCLLDYAAACNDLLHGRLDNAWAIVRARWDWLRMIPKFHSKRKDIQSKKNSPVTTITPCSIFISTIWQTIKK